MAPQLQSLSGIRHHLRTM